MYELAIALDARPESELFEGFHELIGDRSALLISHRLSTVRMANSIYVMENRAVAEQGTHEDLVRLGGVYAGLFSTQTASYLGAWNRP